MEAMVVSSALFCLDGGRPSRRYEVLLQCYGIGAIFSRASPGQVFDEYPEFFGGDSSKATQANRADLASAEEGI
jgi:hypothetical protein